MRKKQILFIALCTLLLALGSTAYAGFLPYNNTFVHVANDSGTRYAGDQESFGAPVGSYYLGLTNSGKGMNSIGISTAVVNTTTGSASGTFYISDSGGQGYSDDIILLLSASRPISNNFQATIQSSGWVFPSGNPGGGAYQNNVLNETFTKADFIYGPQTYRLASLPDHPFYDVQDTSDPSTAMYLMFIDLYVGTLSNRDNPSIQPVAVTYSLSGLDTQEVAFNAYAWKGSASAGSGINWTNYSGGYLVNSAPAPVPLPPAFLLLGSGLAGMMVMRWRKHK